MHRYRRDPFNVIDWFDYRVAGGDPLGRQRFRGRRLHRAWRRHRPWLGRVLLGLVLVAIAAAFLSRRNRRSYWF